MEKCYQPKSEDESEESNNMSIDSSVRQAITCATSQEYLQYKSFKEEEPILVNHQYLSELFIQNHIFYDPHGPYVKFNYLVSQFNNLSNYYRIHARISHFSLQLLVATVQIQNPFQNSNFKEGNYGQVYFPKYQNKKICIKSFPFENINKFQNIFPKVVREWCINRICSVLQCAPYIERDLGFDLVIYDNCIQYATECCQKLQPIHMGRVSEQLKNEMRLIHQLKIIHFDIKPENIVFSPHFKKAIFIDFGFSDIIQEQSGLKTLTIFKGTPKYCCPQMIQLLLQKQGLVDVYYNDLFSLNCTLEQFRMIKQPEEDSNEQKFNAYNTQKQQNNIQKLLFMLPFSYHYLQKQLNEVNLMVRKNESFVAANIAEILQFICKVINNSFLADFVFITLKMYGEHYLYKQIQGHFRLYSETLFIQKINKTQANIIPKSIRDEETKIGPLSYDGVSQIQIQSYDHYLTILTNKSQTDQLKMEQIISIAFDCLRFDFKNLQISKKYEIAKMVNIQFLQHGTLHQDMKHEQEKQDPPQIFYLKQIRIFVVSVFKYCLQNQHSYWAKENFFNVLYQAILLQINILQFSDFIGRFMSDTFKSDLELVRKLLQCRQLLELILWKKKSPTLHVGQVYLYFLRIIIESSNSFNAKKKPVKSKETRIIRDLFDYIQGTSKKQINSIQSLANQLQCIRNPELFNLIKYFILKDFIKNSSKGSNIKAINEIVGFLKNNPRKCNFHQQVNVNLCLMKAMHSFADIQKYSIYIQSILNCNMIFQSLKIQRFPQGQAAYYPYLKDKLKEIHYLYPQLRPVYSRIDIQLLNFFQLSEKHLISMDEQMTLMLRQIYNFMMDHKLDIRSQRVNTHFYYLSFIDVKIQYYFRVLSSEFAGLFMESHKLARQQSELDTLKATSNEGKKTLRYFILGLYDAYNCYYGEQYNKAMTHLEQALHIVDAGNLMQVGIRILEQLNNLSILAIDDDKSIRHVDLLYNYCLQNASFLFYLYSVNYIHTIRTLVILAKFQRPRFYQFLNHITSTLNQFPVDSYCHTFFKSINVFTQTQAQAYEIFRYHPFQEAMETFQQDNPYNIIYFLICLEIENNKETKLKIFKKINKNIIYLSQYARNSILVNYVRILLQLIRGNTRKYQFLLLKKAKYYTENIPREEQLRRLSKSINNRKPPATMLKKYLKKLFM